MDGKSNLKIFMVFEPWTGFKYERNCLLRVPADRSALGTVHPVGHKPSQMVYSSAVKLKNKKTQNRDAGNAVEWKELRLSKAQQVADDEDTGLGNGQTL